MQKLILILTLLLAVQTFAEETAIRHKMLLLDESRGQILYVDQTNPDKNWTINVGKGGEWDAQLIGKQRILVAATMSGGFKEYDLTTQKVVREVIDGKYKQTMSAIRFPDGRTVLACNQKNVKFYVFDADGKEIKEIDLPGIKGIRLVRRSPRNTLLFGGEQGGIHGVWEFDLDGKELRHIAVPGAKYNYQVSELPNGNLLAATGYSCTLIEIGKNDVIVKTLGGNPAPEGLWYLFYSKFQVLPNGHTVLATWTGHGADDSDKGQQIIEFDKEGKVVWTWHDPKLAGSLNGVIILDDLDPAEFHEE